MNLVILHKTFRQLLNVVSSSGQKFKKLFQDNVKYLEWHSLPYTHFQAQKFLFLHTSSSTIFSTQLFHQIKLLITSFSFGLSRSSSVLDSSTSNSTFESGCSPFTRIIPSMALPFWSFCSWLFCCMNRLLHNHSISEFHQLVSQVLRLFNKCRAFWSVSFACWPVHFRLKMCPEPKSYHILFKMKTNWLYI